MNKNIIIGAVVVGVLALGGYFLFIQKGVPGTKQESAVLEKTIPVTGTAVEMKDFSFSPKTLTVKVGTVVTFTNRDIAAHTITADDGSFETGLLKKDEVGSVKFDQVGTFTYHCTPHPNMKGTVIVE